MNIVILQGRIVDEIMVKDMGEFKTCNFTIAVRQNFKNRNGEYGTDFIQCQASNQQALFLQQYFHKGDPINIEGSWRVRVYDKEDGTRTWFNTCVVRSISFALTQRRDNSIDSGNGSNTAYNQNTNYSQNNNYNQNTNQNYNQNRQPVNDKPVYQEPRTNVIPGKMSSWQQPVTQNTDVSKDIGNQPAEENYIPQAFDIPMDDEFLPNEDGFLF